MKVRMQLQPYVYMFQVPLIYQLFGFTIKPENLLINA